MPNPKSGTKNILGCTALLAFLMAGSCAAPTNDGFGLVDRGADNHPITVAPEYRAIQLSASGAGLSPEEAARFDQFITSWRHTSSGSISITVAEGMGASSTISYYGEKLAAMGVPRDRIIVSTRSNVAPGQVEIGFIGYQASVQPCGNWSSNLGYTASNRVSKNFGCANQNNLAAMVSDPRDLIGPRTMDSETDMKRRATVADKYQKGDITANTKNADNKAAVSEVNRQ